MTRTKNEDEMEGLYVAYRLTVCWRINNRSKWTRDDVTLLSH